MSSQGGSSQCKGKPTEFTLFQLQYHFRTYIVYGIREFVDDTDGPAFLEKELVGLGVDGYW